MAMLFRDRLLYSSTEVLGILRHPPEGRASCQDDQEQRNENGNRPSHRVSPCPASPCEAEATLRLTSLRNDDPLEVSFLPGPNVLRYAGHRQSDTRRDYRRARREPRALRRRGDASGADTSGRRRSTKVPITAVSIGLRSRKCTPIPVTALASLSCPDIHATRPRTERGAATLGRAKRSMTSVPGGDGCSVAMNIPPWLRLKQVP